MSKGNNYYLHTLDDKPAYFDGRQICFCFQGGDHRSRQRLVRDLKQIRKEQEASRRWRDEMGYENSVWRYGYVRVSLPDG